MSTQADIKSIDTLSLVKLAMITYAHDSSQALAEIKSKVNVELTGSQLTALLFGKQR